MDIKTFKTVIVVRDASSSSPSDLEVKLSQNTEKLRVAPPMPHGADFLFPSSDTTVAIRLFDQNAIMEMEEKYSTDAQLILSNDLRDIGSLDGRTNIASDDAFDDFGGIKKFRDSFKHSIVFFILSKALLEDQLSRMDSIVNTLQRCLASQRKSNQVGDQQIESGNSRVYIVFDVDEIISIISSTLKSLDAKKRSLKEAFFRNQAEVNYLPDPETGQVRPSNHISNRVSNAFRLWSSRMDLSVDDANVMMHVLGSLEKIMDATEAELNDIPVDPSMKHSLLKFFRSVDKDDHQHQRINNTSEIQERDLQHSQSKHSPYFTSKEIAQPIDTVESRNLCQVVGNNHQHQQAFTQRHIGSKSGISHDSPTVSRQAHDIGRQHFAQGFNTIQSSHIYNKTSQGSYRKQSVESTIIHQINNPAVRRRQITNSFGYHVPETIQNHYHQNSQPQWGSSVKNFF